MDEAEQLCDRLVIMDQGKIVAEGSPLGLINEHATREVLELRFAQGQTPPGVSAYDGLAKRVEVLRNRVILHTDDAERTAAAVADRSIVPESTLVRRSTLEDVFLTLTGRTLID